MDTSALPYDFTKLDSLLDAAGIDVLLASSKHNVQYLLGGYRFIFFSAMDAIGHSRYLPIIAYTKGAPDQTAFVANKMEGGEHANHPFWTPNFQPVAWGSVDSMTAAIAHLKKTGQSKARIGIEPGFLPFDAGQLLQKELPDAVLVDATHTLERLRAVKTAAELDLLREATARISASMQATLTQTRAGMTKSQIMDILRLEETTRGLNFEYALVTLGASHNRARSEQVLEQGDVISLDSGGNLSGYIGDICRMGVLGEPDSELRDLLDEVETIQQAAFSKVRAGATGGDFIAHGASVMASLPSAKFNDFFAHGMGVITHEAPFLMTNHPVAYEGIDADKPLEAGMVLSIETTMQHPTRGFIKIEDTVAVTDSGYELFGATGRGWTVSGG